MNRSPDTSVESLESRIFLSASLGAAPPALAFAITAGGPGRDRGNDVAVDALGNSYLAGVYNGPVDFDPSSAKAILPGSGDDDAYVAKYSPAGRLLWARSLNGPGTQEIQSVAVDGDGNVVATGYFESTVDFDPGAAVRTLTSRGAEDAFVWKLSGEGSHLWARQFGGAGREGGVAVTTDRAGGVYVEGMFDAPGEYGPTPGTAKLTPAGGFDDFVVKLTASGAFAFARRIGGTGDEFANGIVVDKAGNVVLVGTFIGSVDFDPGAGVARLTSAGSADVFFCKLSPAGNYVFAKRIGGKGVDAAGDVQVDAAGDIYLDGAFTDSADFDPGVGASTLYSAGGGSDAFVAKYTSDGKLAWARHVGGTLTDRATDLTLDGGGNVFITGVFAGTADFDPSGDEYILGSHNATSSLFVEELSSNGVFEWAVALGGDSSLDVGEGIALDPLGNIYVAGAFGAEMDFDPGAGTLLRSAAGSQPDAFLLRIAPSPTAAQSALERRR